MLTGNLQGPDQGNGPKINSGIYGARGLSLGQEVRTDGPSQPRPAAALSTRAGPVPPAFHLSSQ